MAKLKTSIVDIPVANSRIYAEVAKGNKTTITEVKAIIDFMGTYTAGVIKEGAMEAVMIPYFGKFKPKVEKLRIGKLAQQNRSNGMDMVYRAMRNKGFKDHRIEELRTPEITNKQPEDDNL